MTSSPSTRIVHTRFDTSPAAIPFLCRRKQARRQTCTQNGVHGSAERSDHVRRELIGLVFLEMR